MFVNFCDYVWMCGIYLMNCFNDIVFDIYKKRRSGFSYFKKLIWDLVKFFWNLLMYMNIMIGFEIINL